MSTCNRLDLQTQGSQPTMMPKNLPDHQSYNTSVRGRFQGVISQCPRVNVTSPTGFHVTLFSRRANHTSHLWHHPSACWANQHVHWFLGSKGLGIQQGTSVWGVRPNPVGVSRCCNSVKSGGPTSISQHNPQQFHGSNRMGRVWCERGTGLGIDYPAWWGRE